MKRLAVLLLSLLLPIAALAQSPGVGLDALPSASALGGGELIFMYQPGAGGGGAAICARGWCPVSATPLQVATYITGLGRFTTITGAITTGHCVEWASATSLEDAGAACGAGGGAPTNAAALASNSMGQIIAATTVPLFTGSFTATHCVNVSSGSPVTFSDAGSACGAGGSGLNQLTGDVTAGPGTGSQAATVVGVNGAAVPTTTAVLASNSSGQLVAATNVTFSTGAFTASDCVSVAATSPLVLADAGTPCSSGTGGPFSTITSGTNTVASMVVGAGASLTASGGGTIAATTAAALAPSPSQCGGGDFATGIAGNGNANCATPAGAGNVSNVSTPLQFQLPVWTDATHIAGIAVPGSSNEILTGGPGGNPAWQTSIDLPGLNTDSAPVGGDFLLLYSQAATLDEKITVTNFLADLSIPTFTGAITSTHCAEWSSSGVLEDSGATCGGGPGSTTFQTNGSGLTSSSTVNFEDSAATAGLTLSFANPSAGNVQLGFSGTLTPAGGGTGVSTAPTDGQLLIGKTSTSVYTPATLTAGSNISITNGSGAITISASGTLASKQVISWTLSSVGQATGQCGAVSTWSSGTQCAGSNGGTLAALAGTVKNLYVHSANNPASGQTFTYTFYIGTPGSMTTTTVTCQVTSSSSPVGSCHDTSDTGSITVGQGMGLNIVTSATSGSTGPVMVSFEFDPS